MNFKLHEKRRYNTKKKKTKESRYCYHSKVYTQVVSTTCLFEILVCHYFHIVLLKKGVSNKGIFKALIRG